jgi:hypothetical protein
MSCTWFPKLIETGQTFKQKSMANHSRSCPKMLDLYFVCVCVVSVDFATLAEKIGKNYKKMR